MSYEKDPSFGVKALNSSSVANFSSTEDDSYILIVANNCNSPVNNGNSYDTTYNNNNRAALFGVNLLETTHNQEAYIGIRNNNLARKIAKFNSDCINLDVNTIINGNIVPSETSTFDLGSSSDKWNSLYLNDTLVANTIIGDGYNITNLNLSRYDTSYLQEGTNLYWTQERFDQSLKAISLDNINQGSSNRCITNDRYSGDLSIEGLLSVKSLYIADFQEFKNNNPDFDNIDLTYNITQVIAESTSVVPEGSNLYFTNKRVNDVIDVTKNELQQEILFNSNLFTRNISLLKEDLYRYVDSQNDTITSNYFNNKYDELQGEIIDTSNFVIRINSNYILLGQQIDEKTKEILDVIDAKELIVTGTASSIITNILPRNRVIVTDSSGIAASSVVTLTELNSLRNIEGNVMEKLVDIGNTISTLTLDSIGQGILNKSIVEDLYDGDLTINGTLSVSNLNIIGSTTSYSTSIYDSEQLLIENLQASQPSIIINHQSVFSSVNVLELRNNNKPVLYVTSKDYVGIGVSNPSSKLHVNGTINASHFSGQGDLLTNVYLGDKTTDNMKEGSNLYFTKKRVNEEIDLISCDRILQGTSNRFIQNNTYSDDLTIKGGLTVDYLFLDGVQFIGSNFTSMVNLDKIVDGTSNKMIINNTYSDDLTIEGGLTADYLFLNGVKFTGSNYEPMVNLDKMVDGTSNKMIINNTYSDDLTIEGGLTADYLFLNGVKFTGSNYEPILHIDNMIDGTSNKMIINNTYNNDLKINGTLEANNLLIHNNISLVNNSFYSSECLDIANYTNSTSINVLQIGTGDIMRVENDYNEIFVMKNNGFFGNVEEPMYNIDISGTIHSSYFQGDGRFLTNVNIGDNDTNQLKEGEKNLYFTKERVYDILFSSNYYSSNPFTHYLDEVYDNTNDKIGELKKAIYGIDLDHVVQGSNNKYIVNNIYNDSLVIDGTLTVRQINIIDGDTDYKKIYNDSLYSYPNSAFNFTFDYTNISNVVVDVLSHINIEQSATVISDQNILGLQNQVSEIQHNFSNHILEMNDIKKRINNVVSLDTIIQGTSNKFIQNNLYNGALFVNGDITTRNIKIVDDHDTPVLMSSIPGTVSSQTISQSLESFLNEKNFEKQINDVFETLSYTLELQNTILVQKLNNVANEIDNIKSVLNL